MESISSAEWHALLASYRTQALPADVLEKLQLYLDLLLRWNARMNLTAVHGPRQIIQRHFGESLLAERYVPRGTSTLLDHGSGAGFPGLPIALLRPEIQVTLSESQAKKAAFLREAIRTTDAANATVHSRRTEDLPADQKFNVVTMRAVDNPESAWPAAIHRVADDGRLLVLGSAEAASNLTLEQEIPIPNSAGLLQVYVRIYVPRGT